MIETISHDTSGFKTQHLICIKAKVTNNIFNVHFSSNWKFREMYFLNASIPVVTGQNPANNFSQTNSFQSPSQITIVKKIQKSKHKKHIFFKIKNPKEFHI